MNCFNNQTDELLDKLKKIAVKTIDDCTFPKMTKYFGEEENLKILLPSGDEKYFSFWVRDCAMMAESKLIPNELLKLYIEITANCGQNGEDTICLENGLFVPPHAVADHINYDGKPVYFPGTYSSDMNQGDGSFGFFPPFCDNFYFILMCKWYIEQSSDKEILRQKFNGITLAERLEKAFRCYNIDSTTDLCFSDSKCYTVDWGFADTVKKSGKLMMPSVLRYNAARALEQMFADDEEKKNKYKCKAEKIKSSILSEFYDENSGWFYSAAGIGRQYDVWATVYAVYSGITDDSKTLEAVWRGYIDESTVKEGYVRHIPETFNFSDITAWEISSAPFNHYQNGGYWATATGWYAYALYLYNGKLEILYDFLEHTEKNYRKRTPYEWFSAHDGQISGLNYGTSGVLPYVGLKKILAKLQ